MKRFIKFFLGVFLCLMSVTGAFAQQPPPDYLSADTVALSPKEQEALRLASAWSEDQTKPIHTGNGKVTYMLGATMPTVIVEPMTISDIELQAGEIIYDVLVGDSQRWLIEIGTSGSSEGDVSHVFVKPIDTGLKTSLVITTSRRVYHIKLVSNRNGATPYVGFMYPEQRIAIQKQLQQQQNFQKAETVDGQLYDMSQLNFNYKINGYASWKPVQVYDSGAKTYVKLPDRAALGEIPVLLVMRGSSEMLVNYRFRNNTYEVDGVFEKLVLISGVGSNQVKVSIDKE